MKLDLSKDHLELLDPHPVSTEAGSSIGSCSTLSGNSIVRGNISRRFRLALHGNFDGIIAIIWDASLVLTRARRLKRLH